MSLSLSCASSTMALVYRQPYKTTLHETKSLDAKGSHRFVIYMNPPPFQKNRALISIKDIEYPEKL